MNGKDDVIIRVPNGEDPYIVIGQYIENHVTAIEDIIATIDINGSRINELFMVDMDVDGFFIWISDWYEGEENVSLVDFFPVSEAQKPKQKEPCEHEKSDTISRQAAIKGAISVERADGVEIYSDEVVPVSYLKNLPSAEPGIIRCRDCKHWGVNGLCDVWDHYISNNDFYCGCAEVCRSDLRGEQDG